MYKKYPKKYRFGSAKEIMWNAIIRISDRAGCRQDCPSINSQMGMLCQGNNYFIPITVITVWVFLIAKLTWLLFLDQFALIKSISAIKWIMQFRRDDLYDKYFSQIFKKKIKTEVGVIKFNIYVIFVY